MSNPNIKLCPRCEKPCLASTGGNQQARPVRKSNNGMCLECTTTSVLLSLPGADMMPKDAVLLPHIQEQFGAVLRAGNADPDANNIDWERIAENWGLPFPKGFAPEQW
jgi:hypothetical protein